MKAKKLTALFIGLVQPFALLPMSVFAAEGDYKASLVAAGRFTPDGLVDLVDDGVGVDSVCGTGNGYDATAKRYVGYVTNGADYYSLRLPESRRNKLTTSAGYTLETYFSLGSINDLSKPNDCKSQGIIGAAQSGGFDFEMNKNNQLEVWVNNNGTNLQNSSKKYPGSGLTLEANKWYHITATVSPTNVSVYHDGKLLESVDVEGGYKLAFPNETDLKDHYGLVIGGDYAPANTPSNKTIQSVASAGSKFAFANIYSKALTAAEVAEAYKENVTDNTDDLPTAIEKASALVAADEQNEELENLRNEGIALIGKSDLSTAEVDAYVKKVTDKKAEIGNFPFAYNPSHMNMPTGVAIADYAARYGITASGIWGMQKVANDDSKQYPALRFSVNTSSKPTNADIFNLKFANDQVNVPVMNKEGYIYETEVNTVLKSAKKIDIQFKGADSEGAEKNFAAIRIERAGTATSGGTSATANVFAVDKDGKSVGTQRSIKVSTSKSDSTAGDTVYYKAKINMLSKTVSLWAVPRMTESGAYSETPASDENLLIADFPFYDDAVAVFTGVTHHADNNGSAIQYTSGTWIKNIRVDEYDLSAVHNVTGTVDAGAESVTLNQGGEVKYTGVINGTDNTVSFSGVKSGIYDIAVTYANGYEAAANTSTSVRVIESDVTGLTIISSKIPEHVFTVSGTTDKHVTKVTLNQNDEVKYTGEFNDEHTVVTFSRVEDGTYDIVTEYDMNYTAADAAEKTVTVSGADVTSLAVTSKAPLDGITLRVAVVSDMQYGRDGTLNRDSKKFHMAMDGIVKKAKEKGNPDVLMIPGDISHNSYDSEMKKFYEDLNSYLTNYPDIFADTKVLLLRGNHDAKDNTDIAGKEKTGGKFVKATRDYFDPDYVAD